MLDVSERPHGANANGLRTHVKAALARWVLHKRRDLLDGGRPRPAAHDEATHPWDGRRRFAEDYVFATVQDDLGLLVRLEWLPGRAAHRVWLMLLRDGEAWWIPPEQTIVTQTVVDRWHVAGLALDCVKPLMRWTLRYQGRLHPAAPATPRAREPGRRCELNLVFDATGDPFVPGVDDDPELVARRLGEAHWDPALLRAVRRAARRGYVQVGRFVGTAVLGHDVARIDGVGVRQHGWGVQDWGAPERAVQSLIVDGDTVAWIQQAEFPAFTLEGGFAAGPSGWQSITALRQAIHTGGECELEIDGARGPRRWSLPTRHTVEMRVDGRGSFDLAFVGRAGGVLGLWATQGRTLPRSLAVR